MLNWSFIQQINILDTNFLINSVKAPNYQSKDFWGTEYKLYPALLTPFSYKLANLVFNSNAKSRLC